MLPDLGLAYLNEGFSRDASHHFYDVPFEEIDFVAPHSYSVMLNKAHKGEVHALSLDFSDDILAELLAHLPAGARKTFGKSIIGKPFPFRAKLPSQVTVFAVECHLGQRQHVANEEFVPFIIARLT